MMLYQQDNKINKFKMLGFGGTFFLFAYVLLDRGTHITYTDVSLLELKELSTILIAVQRTPCRSDETTQETAVKLNQLFDFDFSVKGKGILVNGHYFECVSDKDMRFTLNYFDPSLSP